METLGHSMLQVLRDCGKVDLADWAQRLLDFTSVPRSRHGVQSTPQDYESVLALRGL